MKTVTLIKGDGIGPEIANACLKIFEKANVNIDWDIQLAGLDAVKEYGTPLPNDVIESIKKNKIALKAPCTTPIGKGFRSINVALRKELDLYASVREAKNLNNIKTRYENVDITVIRENTEDLYAGIERKIDDDTCESIKVITRDASMRIGKYAFDYAIKNNRKKVTAVTKANICKLTDGLFLECVRNVAKEYENKVEYNEILVDNACMQLVINPNQFDVMVLPNLYGDIVSDLTSGLVGGLGVAPGANIGKDYAVFEAVHGSAPDIAGKNIANPTALLRSGILMLEYMGENDAANNIKNALYKVFDEGKVKTSDLGGNASTDEFVDAIVTNLK
ncbi:MAG: isocitrate dehydrogenase [Candidatus Melainabacteria bacterium LEY3_CP_29_8]|nr:MAG: isocitrate dehydrogenase [Candidatus Melainabacteria bacterium LEY3_CP_29_8]